ncbi:hypothetical protein PV325_002387 [Microctonus aethiopoides]|nr:hypothetical protein PV325_002387 [Microctonus aethiopoides]KAK0093677.1 hypothetical protein PV326_012935 [Microctonus aethiopoides]
MSLHTDEHEDRDLTVISHTLMMVSCATLSLWRVDYLQPNQWISSGIAGNYGAIIIRIMSELIGNVASSAFVRRACIAMTYRYSSGIVLDKNTVGYV